MKKTLLFLLVISAFNVNAASTEKNSTIVCGDTNSAYATAEMQDLSEKFVADYLSANDRKAYAQLGFKYIIAGRNCGLNRYDSNIQFEVLYLFQAKNTLKELIDLGALSIFSSQIAFNGQLIDRLEGDLILSGDSKSLLQVEDTFIGAKLKSGRGSGKVKVIIRQK